MCALIFSTSFLRNNSHPKKNGGKCKQNLYCSLCKVPVILVMSLMNLNFLDIFSQNTHQSNFMKISPSGSRVVPYGRTDRRTYMTELIVSFAVVRTRLKIIGKWSILSPTRPVVTVQTDTLSSALWNSSFRPHSALLKHLLFPYAALNF
jgi:hypothetical protein